MEEHPISIEQFQRAISRLPEDELKKREGIWYLSQKEHWLGWLDGYYGPGGYNRKNWNRDAKFVYNHIVCPDMLIYLIHNLSLKPELVEAAEKAYQIDLTEMARAGAIRKAVPWSEVYQAIWGNEKISFFTRVFTHNRTR